MSDTIARQGDLLIVPLTKFPDGLKKSKNKIVAYGEVTGHKHQVRGSGAAVLEVSADEKYVDATDEWTLHHDEHDTIKFGAGKFEIRRQREYTPEEIRMVVD